MPILIKKKINTIMLACLSAFLVFYPSSSQAISVIQEKEIAVEFMKMIEKHKTMVYDPIVLNLVTTVGRAIMSELPTQPFDYRFYIIEDPTFNAFAAPAANIFVNTGLLAALDTVDELAGILGHEIAHAASRHVAESIDRSKIVSIGTLAGVLAGVLVGSKSDSELGQGISMGALAMGQSSMLTFTRENESDADQKGFSFLKQTCYSPTGLLSGLMKIRASDWQGIEGIPDYFKTHPGTKSRIAHVVSLVENESSGNNANTCGQDFRYDMIQQRIIGLYEEADPAEKRLTALLVNDPDNASYHYGLALVLARKSKTGEALSHLKKALLKNIFDPMVLLEIGRIHLLDGNPQSALTVLTSIDKHPVMESMIAFYRGNARLDLGDLPNARKDLEKVIFMSPKAFPKAYYHLADICSREQKSGESHYYLGRYYEDIKNDKNAIFHYKKSLETLTDETKIEKAKQQIDLLNKQKDRIGS